MMIIIIIISHVFIYLFISITLMKMWREFCDFTAHHTVHYVLDTGVKSSFHFFRLKKTVLPLNGNFVTSNKTWINYAKKNLSK